LLVPGSRVILFLQPKTLQLARAPPPSRRSLKRRRNQRWRRSQKVASSQQETLAMVQVEAAKHKLFYTVEELRDDERDMVSEYPKGIFPGNPRGTGEYGLQLLDNAARASYLGESALAKRFYAVAMECI